MSLSCTRVTVVHSLHSYSHSSVSSQLLPSKLRALGAWAGTRHKNSAQNIDLQRISKEIRAYVKICIFFLQSYILLCPRSIGRTKLIWIGLWVCTHTHTQVLHIKENLFFWIWFISLTWWFPVLSIFLEKMSLFYFYTLLYIFITFSFFMLSLIDIEPSWLLRMNTDVQVSLYCWLRVPWVPT